VRGITVIKHYDDRRRQTFDYADIGSDSIGELLRRGSDLIFIINYYAALLSGMRSSFELQKEARPGWEI